MSVAGADSVSTETLAFSQARANFNENREALRAQQNLAIGELPHTVEWVFARDRALTFRTADRKWFTGSSLPRRAAAEMMQKLDVSGPVACFLSPTHSAQLRVALDILRPEQAIIAIVSDADQLPALLACEHFVNDIERRRLWLVAGDDWANQLNNLFDDRAGLCTPTQFIRLPILEEALVEQLIPLAQKVFSDVNTQRTSQVRQLRETYRSSSSRICVVGASRFRLWDDAGACLCELLSESDVVRIDLDNPLEASTLMLAQRSHDCGAVVAAGIARSDLPPLVSDSLRWITWAGNTRIPGGGGTRDHDRIITAHPDLAIHAGWKSHQIVHASFPAARGLALPSAKPQAAAAFALIADTQSLDVPVDLSDYSSHRVLWELIANDLLNDPFVLTQDIEEFVTRRMRKLHIAAQTLSVPRFINELILPAYQQSIARLLIRNKIPLRLFGAKWDRIPEFAPFAAGAVTSREQLHEIAKQHIALVHAWPHTGSHAIDALGRAVLRRRGNVASALINDARQLLTGRAISAPEFAPPLSAQMILKLLA